MPPVTADVASNTWNNDTSGKIDATSETTFGSLLNMYAHEDRKIRKSALVMNEMESASKMDVFAASLARCALCSPRRFPILFDIRFVDI